MHKVNLTYEDYNGDTVTEDLYFNLTKAELLDMNFEATGGLVNYMESIINARDVATLNTLFKNLLLKAYGEKTPDGKHFMKTPEIALKFQCSIPFDILYTRFSTDADAASEFITSIVPKDVVEEYKKADAEGKIPEELKKYTVQKI